MNKHLITILGIAALVGLTGCSGGEEEAASEELAQKSTDDAGDHGLPGDPEAGAEVYGRVCAACHAQDGTGNGGLTGADFVNDETRLAKSNSELLGSIRDGVLDASPPMPPQGGNLSEQEMKDALSYIRQEFGGK